MNIADLVSAAGRDHGTRPAMVGADGDEVTWAAMDDAVSRAAGAIQAAGVSPGHRVGVMLPNSPAFAAAYWGALRAGAVVVPVNPAYTAPEASHILGDAGVTAVVADPRLAELVRAAAPDGTAVLVPDDLAGDRDEEVRPANQPGGERRAVICYTSGTTGQPKGAVLTHDNLLTNLASFSELPRLSLTCTDVLLGLLPFFHIFGLNVILNAAARAGACVAVMERFSPAGSLEALARAGVTVAYGAPPVFAAWNAVAADRPDLPALRAAVSGADALPVRTWEGFHAAYGLEILEGYGLTETAPVVASSAVSPTVRPGTVGHPVPDVEIRIVDPTGADCATGTEGEILVRGPNVFSGYEGQLGATEEVFTDGWFHTGDTGSIDADGYLSIVGRLKDMLIVSGFNVYPREVEAAILTHPDVAEVAVIGVPDGRTGQRVRAVVVPRPGADLQADAVRAHCKERLARYKQPRDVEIAQGLPRTALGKLARAELRASAGPG